MKLHNECIKKFSALFEKFSFYFGVHHLKSSDVHLMELSRPSCIVCPLQRFVVLGGMYTEHTQWYRKVKSGGQRFLLCNFHSRGRYDGLYEGLEACHPPSLQKCFMS